MGGLQLAGTTLSQRRAASGVDSIEALMALRRRTLSFTAPGAPGGLGEVGGEVSLQDFHLIKVLGKGRYVYAALLFLINNFRVLISLSFPIFLVLERSFWFAQ